MRMSDEEFDDFVDNLQEKIFAEARDVYGEKGFDRWRNPKFCGKLEDETVSGRVTGSCGDTIEISLKIEADRIVDGAYTTTGCASSGLCGSFAVELAIGRSMEEVFDLKGEDVLQEIGKFPENDTHCAFLAVNSLQDAANTYMVQKNKEQG